MMITKQSRSVATDPLALIERILSDVELTQTQYEDATESYKAVATVLQKSNPNLTLDIFPQGSMRLGTTVRPLKKDHFDLDMVCQLDVSGERYSPVQVYDAIWKTLERDATYRPMLKPKNRCIRLEYAPERKFHLDVTPAVPDWAQNDSLYVPDRQIKKWCPSHPIGFCDDWFKQAGKVHPNIQVLNRLTASARSTDYAFANSSVEEMPEYGEFEKTPLQRIVQMLKRDRDEFYQDDTTHRLSSILLTTIITHSYSSVVYRPVSSLLEFVAIVVGNLPNHIQVTGPPEHQKYSVINPVNPLENFAENWNPEHHRRFNLWHQRAINLFTNVQAKGLGTDVVLTKLSENFGKAPVVRAASALGADTSSLHENGKLRVKSAIVGTVGSQIPKTIYFGNEK